MKTKGLPLVTAHTGCMKTPPNSVESVLEGLKAGADIVEVDVNATKDGVAVLFHDLHIHTHSRGTVNVYDLTFEELREAVKIASPTSDSHNTRITRLEEVLDVVQQHRMVINLDLKSYACLKPMTDAVKFRKMVDNVLISGCYQEHALYVKRTYPEFQVLLNAAKNVSKLDETEYDSYIKTTCRDAIAASCCGINMHYQDCREEMLYYARLRCLPVLIYTVDSKQEMEQFLRSDVHSITTNEVSTLLSIVYSKIKKKRT